jgi:putative transposase
VKYAFIEAQEVAFSVQAMCQVLGVSRSGYYDWKERPEPRADGEAVVLSAEITATHKRSRGTYGSPRVHRELRARGILISRKLRRAPDAREGLAGRPEAPIRCTTDSRHSLPIAPNTLGLSAPPTTPSHRQSKPVRGSCIHGDSSSVLCRREHEPIG